METAVTEHGKFAGTNLVTSEFGGCVVQEHWQGVEGGRGSSFNTWVTDQATPIGGLKYKTLVYTYPDGGTRFAGVLPAPARHAPILDRTTLRPVDRHRVHQVIEISRDGGEHWTTTFDALYTRVK